ncbi:MAG: AraC family transcriptional regulator [Bacteroidota bacterium]
MEITTLAYKIAHTPVMTVPVYGLLEVSTESPYVLTIHDRVGEGYVERLELTKGFSIQISKFSSPHIIEVQRQGTTNDALLIIDFHVRGIGKLNIHSKTPNSKHIDTFKYGVYFAHSSIESKGVFPPKGINEQIHLVMDKNWLLEEYSDMVQEVFGKANIEGPFFIFERLNAAMIKVVYEIITSDTKPAFRKTYLKAKSLELITLFLKELGNRRDFVSINDLNSLDVARLFELETHISNNLDKDLSVPNIAKTIGFSESKLQKLFKHVYGTSVHKKITEIKMVKALELLDAKELSIYQIGHEMGYLNTSHFSAAFRKVHGFLPSEY